MARTRRATPGGGTHPGLAGLVRNVSYEVMPFKSTEQAVLAEVPRTVGLTVTVTAAKGVDATLDLTARLLLHGYRVAPHLPARQFRDGHHVADVVARLSEAGAREIFVIGGDDPTPAGAFPDAYSLLQAIESTGHRFTQVGVGGYPEGHALIPRESLDLALKQKAPMATRIITQICFAAETTGAWARDLAGSGVDVPVHVGVPGPVSRQKLMRISAGIGLGQSARFLKKQQNLLWRFLLPGGYNPTTLVRRLGAEAAKPGTATIGGLHIFTFNELRKTERWRRELLDSVEGVTGA